MSRGDKAAEATQRPVPADASDKEAFVGRLQVILAHWPSADRLARSTGVSPSAFRKWLKGEAEPSRERLILLARAAGVGVAWLAEGQGPVPVFDPPTGRSSRSHHGSGARHQPGPRDLTSETDWSGFALLPRRPEAAAAGSATPEPPLGSEYMALRHDWIRATCGVEPSELELDTAVGESMMPTIGDGDVLLIDTTDQDFHRFGIYVLEINGQRLVKRVQRKTDGSLVLISDNNVYLPEIVTRPEADGITIIGRVVWTGGPI